jgi:dihydrofolate reductase
MRKIILWASVSLDGYFAGADGGLSWQRISPELHQHFNDDLRTMSAFLDGRVTWELMAGHWPYADKDPAATKQTAEFAAIWRDMPKIVYSRTLTQADWNTTVASDVDPEQIAALKAEPGGDMVLGGANLAATFLRLDLVDAYQLYLQPVVIGAGKPLFPAGFSAGMRLSAARTFGNGVVLLRYERE